MAKKKSEPLAVQRMKTFVGRFPVLVSSREKLSELRVLQLVRQSLLAPGNDTVDTRTIDELVEEGLSVDAAYRSLLYPTGTGYEVDEKLFNNFYTIYGALKLMKRRPDMCTTRTFSVKKVVA